MPELRRLAVAAQEPARLAGFYREVFQLGDIAAANGSVFLSDGSFNLALIPANESSPAGLSYLGFQMARLESIEKKLALVHYTGTITEPYGDAEIEYEIQDPDGTRIGLCKRAFDTSYEKGPVPVRHIALFTGDPEKLGNFYVTVFGMKVVDRSDRSSIFVSDGYINLALLYQRSEERVGLNHFGFQVRNNEEIRGRAERAGALGNGKRPDRIPFAEYRLRDPERNGIDISEKGWKC